MVLGNEQREQLLQSKLRALVIDAQGVAPEGIGGHAGAAVAWSGEQGWFLADGRSDRSLGPAVAWVHRRGCARLTLLSDHHAGDLARRASWFEVPPTVVQLSGRSMQVAEPRTYDLPSVGPLGVESLLAILEEANIDIVVEHGVVTGEVCGLEVARIVPASEPGGDGRLEVGIGRHDREAFAMMHGDRPALESLLDVVGPIQRSRRGDAPVNPLRRLAPERWLRWTLIRQPEVVGLVDLYPVEPLSQRESIKDPEPAPALGVDPDGRTVLVVTSSGVDLDLVPRAADLRGRMRASGVTVDEVRIVVPERDALPVQRALIERLAEPATLVTVPDDWQSRWAS